MGWASGSDLFVSVMEAVYPVLKKLPAKKQAEVGLKIVEAFEGHDWDTLDEGIDDRWPWLEDYLARLGKEGT